MQIKINQLFPGLTILVFTIIFWSPFFLSSGIPWTGDLSRQYYPWYVTLHRFLRSGTFPWWVAEMGNGYPLMAEGEIGGFYPLNWLIIFLFPPLLGFKLLFPIHTLIAGFGTYRIGRSYVSKIAALFAALVFSFSFFFSARVIHPPILFAASFLPWGIYFLTKYLIDHQKRSLIFLSLMTALAFLAGHPQIAFISITTYILYSFTYLLLKSPQQIGQKISRLNMIILAILLGTGIAAIQLLPTFELTQNSARDTQGTSFIFSYSLPRSQLLTFLFPYLFGLTPANSNLGYTQFGGHYWEFALYIGIAPFLLALVGMRTIGKNSWSQIAGVLIIASILLALGGYFRPYRIAVRLLHLPFRVSARFILPLTLFAALLSGVGLNEILAKKNKIPVRFLLTLYAIISSVIFLPVISEKIKSAKNISLLADQFLTRFVFTEFQKLSVVDFSIIDQHIQLTFAVFSVTMAIFILYAFRALSKSTLVIFLLGMILIDPLLLGRQYIAAFDYAPQQFPKVTAQKIFSIEYPEPFGLDIETFQPNIPLLINQRSFNALTPLPLLFYPQMYAAIKNNPQLGSVAGVDYVVSDEKPKDNTTKNLTLDRLYHYRLPNISRAILTHEVIQARDFEQTKKFLQQQLSAQTLIVTSNQTLPNLQTPIHLENEFVTIATDEPLKTTLTVSAETPGMVVLFDSFYPGWQATVDGKQSQIYRINGLFRGVLTNDGRHTIEFHYVPKLFFFGLLISILSLGSMWYFFH